MSRPDGLFDHMRHDRHVGHTPYARWVKNLALTAFWLASLGGCSGGMVGTGTGPDERPVYELEYLPKRIGTDLPVTLIDPAVVVADFGSPNASDDTDNPVISEHWLTLTSHINEIETLRLKTEESLALIDAVLESIQSACSNQTTTPCQLADNRIEGQYSASLIARIEAIYARAFGTNEQSGSALSIVRADLQSRLGRTYALGPVEFSTSDGQPYDFDLRTSLSDVLGNRALHIRWDAARTVSETIVSSQVGSVLDRQYLGFATGLPGERFTYTRDRSVGSGVSNLFDISIVADATPERRILLDARVNRRVGGMNGVTSDTAFRALVDDEQGFATARRYGTVGDAIRSIRVDEEWFTADGSLRAGRSCASRVEPGACSDSSVFSVYGNAGERVTDSALFFDSARFDSLIAMSDTQTIDVVGLPPEVVDFLVLDDDNSLPLDGRDTLCSGVQLDTDDVLVYCSAPDSRLATSVIAIVNATSGILEVLPDARIQLR